MQPGLSRRRLSAFLVGLCLPAVAQTPLGTAFTYQGRLEDAATPANGSFDIRFALYDAPAGGSLIGAALCLDNVTVVNGYFSVPLDFGAVFSGEGRWIEISVRPGGAAGDCGTGAYTLLWPRQALTPAPYALNAAGLALPYAGQASLSSAIAFSIQNSGPGGQTTAIYGRADSNNSDTAGVDGHATGGTAATIGVRGRASSINGTGVLGQATAASGETTGVRGETSSFDGTGVAGVALSGGTGVFGSAEVAGGMGVRGEAVAGHGGYFRATSWAGTGLAGIHYATTGDGPGVIGYSNSTDPNAVGVLGEIHRFVGGTGGTAVRGVNFASGADGCGVWGSHAAAGYGVQGECVDGRGVFGWATGTGGAGVGVYGQTDSPSGYGGYFVGRGYFSGSLGIGTTSPAAPLDVAGTARMTGFQLPTGAAAGRVLTSDASGVGTWQAAPAGGPSLPYSGNTSQAYPGAVFEVSNSGTGHALRGTASGSAGSGVYGLATSTVGLSAIGGYFQSNSTSGSGVYGLANATSGLTHGVYGLTNSASGNGVYGWASAGLGANYGGYFLSNSTSGTGVFGRASAASGTTYGGSFRSESAAGTGVYGTAAASSGATWGVHGVSESDTSNGGAAGVFGEANGSSGFVYGVWGRSNASPDGTGVLGYAVGASGSTRGVWGITESPSGWGVRGEGPAVGVYGLGSDSSSRGVRGTSSGSFGLGVQGDSTSTSGAGVVGTANIGGLATYLSPAGLVGNSTRVGVYARVMSSSGAAYGVYGEDDPLNAASFAGYFVGDVHVTGTLSKSGGAFKIDHPLDPANRYLSHAFVESPDMKNIYDGVVQLDEAGQAWVELPAWFEALNRDFRYQLTPLGGAAPNLHILQEIADRRFSIAGGRPGQRVCWQVTGIRRDPWAERNRIVVEQEKAPRERGRYLNPELYGADRDLALHRDGMISTADDAP